MGKCSDPECECDNCIEEEQMIIMTDTDGVETLEFLNDVLEKAD